MRCAISSRFTRMVAIGLALTACPSESVDTSEARRPSTIEGSEDGDLVQVEGS